MMDANEIIERCASVADQLAEVLDGANTYEAQDSRLIAELIRTLKAPLMAQAELIAQDAVLHGVGYMQAGKRIDPSEVYTPMTTLTQSELDDLKAEIARLRVKLSEKCREAVDHIAQLTAERDEALTRVATLVCDVCEGRGTQSEYLEGMPCAEFSCSACGGTGLPRAHIAQLTAESARLKQSSDENYTGWCKAEARIAELEAQPSAQFVAGMREAEVDVIAERRRQVEQEGWTAEHDDTHANGELAFAAASYVIAGKRADVPWPSSWNWSWFKPKDRRRDLVKAGALIIAEIERLDRAAILAEAAKGEGK